MRRVDGLTMIVCVYMWTLCAVCPALGFRCGTELITIGDTQSEVLRACGEPDHIEVWEEERIQRDFYRPREPYDEREAYREPFLVKIHVTVERWTYNLGPTRFLRFLRFENGRLVKIRTGDKGY